MIAQGNLARLAADEMTVFEAARLSINASDAKKHVDVLADDSFEGRESGHRGGRAAAGYLAGELTRLEAAPAGVDGFYQVFNRGYRNVLAKIEGSDPTLKNEVIVVCAHYDHVGYGNASNSYGPFGYVHNGADDNASGTAAVLELIEGFKKISPSKRTIMFAFWDGEEQGLLGSRHYVNNPTIPLDQIKFVINLDMIGRLRKNKVTVYGSRSAAGLREFLSRTNTNSDLRLFFDWETKDNSDHWPFFNRGVPFLMLHSGLHDDYHRPRDDSHLINNEGIEAISRLAFNLINDVANQPELPKYRAASRSESNFNRQAFEAHPARRRSRLGVGWKRKHIDREEGLLVNRMTYGSPASAAGIQLGDRIVELNQEPVVGEHKFRWEILTAPYESTIVVRRRNEVGELVNHELPIKLPGTPLRLGIRWRENAGEPNCVTVVQIEAASPTFVAGLRPLDRIYEVNGQRFSNGDEFLRIMNTAAEPVELQIERAGQLQQIEISFSPEEEPSTEQTVETEPTADPESDSAQL